MVVETVLLLLSLIIFTGFFASVFFERFKVPDIIVLLLLGMLLGPVFNVFDPTRFTPFAPLVGAIALVIILFDAGLSLNLYKVFAEVPKATFFIILVFLLSTVLVWSLLHYVFAWSFLHALLLAVVVGGTSSASVFSIVSRLGVPEETQLLLGLESVINDVLCIVAAISVIQVIQLGLVDLSVAANAIAGAFSIAAVAGFAAGVFWLLVLRKFYGKPLSYVITLAMLFLLYAVVEALKGSGAVSAIVFGLVLGNAGEITHALKMKGEFSLDQSIRIVQKEITFFVRTFFFVFLGVVLSLSALTPSILLASMVLVLALLFARFVSAKALAAFDAGSKKYVFLITAMLPRGLAASVLAFMPLNAGIIIPLFTEIVFLIILGTNMIATIGAFYFGRKIAGKQIAKPRIDKIINKITVVKKSDKHVHK